MSLTKKIWQDVTDMNLFSTGFSLGPINAESLITDPKHLMFTLSRYKFVSKMMKKCNHIVEVGCGEGIGTFMFLAETNAKITSIDFDESQINYAKKNILPYANSRVNFVCQDIVSDFYTLKKANGLVCLDVIEHIHPDEQKPFLENYVNILDKKGISIIGTPNKYAEQYAHPRSKKGHINLFTPERLISILDEYFSHNFLFSMNDEIVHTGYDKMAHYFMVLSTK